MGARMSKRHKHEGLSDLPAARRPVERQNVGRSTIGAAEARRRLVESLPGVVYSKPVRKPASAAPRRAAMPARLDPLPSAPRKPVAQRAERLTPKPAVRDEKPLQINRLEGACKERPKSSRGGGGSKRAYVPWCSRKR